ncbi:ankyrin repeat domain-containing protein 30B-like [Rhopilema esculentum]|uniref:ankyrin repeat domain-containing protein 30B-like n=1 Tax=Rhopilema esculentum TaxID=499914 RepID=UPI0031D8F782
MKKIRWVIGDPNLLNIKSSLMTNEDGSVAKNANAAMHEEDHEVVAFHENSHDSGLELRSSSRRINRCNQLDNSVSLESQEVIEMCINIEPQPAEEIPDLLFEEDEEENSEEKIIDEQEISLVVADFETPSSNQPLPEVEQVIPSLVHFETELTSEEPQPAEEIPDLLFEEDEEENSEEKIIDEQEISLVVADFETPSSNQPLPEVEQVTPSLVHFETELTSEEPQPAEEIPDLLFEEDEEENSEEKIIDEQEISSATCRRRYQIFLEEVRRRDFEEKISNDQEISLVVADFGNPIINQPLPEVEQVTPSLVHFETELTSEEPQPAEEIPDLLFEEDEEENSEEKIIDEQEISLVVADFESPTSNQPLPEVEQVTPSLVHFETELTSEEPQPAEEIPDLLFEEDEEENSEEKIIDEQEISLVVADFETPSSNQPLPEVEQVTPSLVHFETELTSEASTNEDGLNLWDLPRLHRAAYKNKIQKLQSLLKKRRVDINKKDVEGRTALHYGCLAGRIQVVRLILDADGKITIDRFGRSPVFMAIKNGHLDIVKVFYGIEFDFNRPDHAGTTPLHYAIFRKKMEIAEYLVKQVHVNVNARDMHISTPLHEAVLAGLPNVVLLLVKNGAETEIREIIGKTPLLLAIVKGEEECVEILLRYGAEIYRTRCSSLAEDKALQFRQKRIYEMLQTYRSKHERRIEFIDPNLLNIKSSLMTNEDGSVTENANAAMHEEDNEVVAFHENSHDSGLELSSSSRRIDRCNQLDNSVSLESQEVIEICINIEPQPAEEIPDLLFEEDGEEYSGEEIIDEQEISLVMADFETSSSNQPWPEVEQVTPSLVQFEAELTSAEPQPAEEIPDLLFEEDGEEYSEEEIIDEQEISLVMADFETSSSNQPLPEVQQVTPSLVQFEAELTSAEPQPAEEIPDLLFEEDEEEYSEEEIVGEQEVSLVFADFETQSSNQPEVEQVTPSLIQLEAELTSAEPRPAEEIPDLLFEEDEEEYSEEEIVGEQEVSLVFADFETQSSNQPEVEQVTPSLIQLEAELTSAEPQTAEEIPDLLFEEDEEENPEEEIIDEQEISLVFADFETPTSNQPLLEVEQVTPSLIQLEVELTSAEPQSAEEIPDLLFEENEEEYSGEEIVDELEISLVFADFETKSSNQPEDEKVTPSLIQLEAELTSAEPQPAEETPDLLFEEDEEEYSEVKVIDQLEISLVLADSETKLSNQPEDEKVTPSFIQLEAELTSAEPQPAEDIPDLLFEEDEEEPSVVLEPPLPFSSSAPIDVNQISSDPSEKPKQELPVYKEEASVWNNNVIQEKEKSLSINIWDIPTSIKLVPQGDEGSTSSEQFAGGSLEKQYPSENEKGNLDNGLTLFAGNNAASSKKLGPYYNVVLSRTGISVYDEEAEKLKTNCNQFVKLLEEIECSFNYFDDGFKRIESRLHGAGKQRMEKEDVVHENKRLALLNEELCKKVEVLSKHLEQEVNMQKGMREYQFNLETDNEQLRLQADKLMKDKNKDEVLLGLLEKENEELLVKSFKLNELEIQEKKTQEEMEKCLTELSKIEDIVKQKDEERTHLEEGIFQLQKKWETEHLRLLEAQEENDSLISKISDYRVKLDHLEREHQLTQEVSKEQRGTISSLNLRKADLSVEIDSLKFRLRSFVNLEEQNESLNEELRKAKNNLRAMENVYTVSMADAIKFRGKYDEACYELEGLQATIDLLSTEKKELSEKCDRLENAMTRELFEHEGTLKSTDGKTKALESNLNLKNVPEDSSFWGNEAKRSKDYKTNFD